MLVLNDNLDTLEGELKLSDCENEFVVRWLSGRSQASFFIGDSDTEHQNIQTFINGNHYCYIDINSYLSYLKTVEHVVKKYRSMYYGPFDHLEKIYRKFSNMKQEDAKVVLSYAYPERYIRILNNKKNYRENVLIYGDQPLENGDDFRHSYVGGITKITIQKKEDNSYWLKIELIDNWRDVIMEANGAKVTLESLISIFNTEMESNLEYGMNEIQSAQVFGIKYAPLLESNKHKFTHNEIINASNYNSQEVLNAVESGISISSAVIWSPDLSKSPENVNQEQTQNYSKFKKILGWFVKQLHINNGLLEGTKTSGQGYKEGASIRRFYKDWREYSNFTLDCNLIAGYQSTFSKVNYINKTDTGINIRPKFDKETKEVKYLYIDVYENNKEYGEDISTILEKEYELSNLGLSDDLEPNDLLKELFDDFSKVVEELTEETIDTKKYDECERKTGGENIILYGVPGAGKSWTIERYYRDENTIMQRVVFHPDYTYSDFVGQILPQSKDGNVSYDFIPGPFTKIVNDAYRNPKQKYILVIEEINRGNAPAIFGDIFQLLDRNKDGRSSYEISNADVAKIVYRDENHPVYLPSNLSIICTMNTSDQNVFTLDTAFQRRWSMRLIENTFKKDTPEEKAFAEHPILDSDIKWEAFCETVNAQILEKNQNLTSSEDKRLGTHFVTIDDLIFDINENNDNITQAERSKAILKNRKFPEKVIKYLWDDAFKFYRDEIFKGEFNSLEKVINEFTSKSKNDRFNIFKDNIKAAIEEANKN